MIYIDVPVNASDNQDLWCEFNFAGDKP